MKKTLILTSFLDENSILNNYNIFIGVEKGALFLKNNEKTLFSISDFDSISKIEKDKLLENNNVIILKKEKDFSDVECAISEAKKNNLSDITVFYQDINRNDHFLNQIQLIKKHNIKLLSKNAFVFGISKNIKLKKNKYTKFSIFSFVESEIAIKNAKYNSEYIKINSNSTYLISNEWIDEKEAEIFVKKGYIIIFCVID